MNTLIIDLALLKADSTSYVSLLPNELIRYIIAFLHEGERWFIFAWREMTAIVPHPRLIYTTIANSKTDCLIQFLNILLSYESYLYKPNNWLAINDIYSFLDVFNHRVYDLLDIGKNIQKIAKNCLSSNVKMDLFVSGIEKVGYRITNKIESLPYYNQ